MNKGSENLEPKSSAGRRVDGAALREVIEPVTLAYGLELVALEWSGDLLRVIIDRSTVAGAPLAGGASSLGAPVAEVPVAGMPVADAPVADAPVAEPPVAAVALAGAARVKAPRGKAPRAQAPRAQAPLAQGGVSLDDCVHVSRDLSVALDVADLIPHAYRLEVSSPGADRPLTSAADYARNVGRLAKCKLTAPAPDGQMVLRGPILGATATSVRIEVDGKAHEAFFTNIREAKLVFEVGGAPKPGKKRGGARPGAAKARRAAKPDRAPSGSHPRGSRHG